MYMIPKTSECNANHNINNIIIQNKIILYYIFSLPAGFFVVQYESDLKLHESS